MADDTSGPSIAEKATKLATATLVGDVRDQILREFKSIPKNWQACTETEQSRLIHVAKDIADGLVKRAVDIVASKGLPALPIEVGKIAMDGAAIKGQFECYADDEALLRIRHLQGSRAMFVLASPDAFNGEQKPAKPEVIGDLSIPEPDQPADEPADRADQAQLDAIANWPAPDDDDIGKPLQPGGFLHRPRAEPEADADAAA